MPLVCLASAMLSATSSLMAQGRHFSRLYTAVQRASRPPSNAIRDYHLGNSKMCLLSPLFPVHTDNRPLEGVFQKNLFDLASPRLQRLREKVAMFSFQVCWVPGKTHLIADALSRAPLFAPEVQPGLEIDMAISYLSQTSHPSINVIYDAIDDDYCLFLDDVKNGTSLSTYSHSLKGATDILSVLPISAVKPILKLLHSSHSGITKTTNLARGLYFWPGMTNDIKQTISTCRDCIRVLQSQPSSPMVTAPPSNHFGFPIQLIGLDLLSFGGNNYLICVDHWSGYPLYQLLRSLTSDAILKVLTHWFNLFGWPSSTHLNMASDMSSQPLTTPRAMDSQRLV